MPKPSKAEEGRFSDSPDKAHFGGQALGFDHPRAVAFCVLDECCVVMSPQGLHHAMFRALKLLNPSGGFSTYERFLAADAQRNVMRHLKSEGITTVPKISGENLAWFFDAQDPYHGHMRRKVHAGRAWVNLREGGKTTSLLSLWTLGRETPDHLIVRVMTALRCKGPAHFEFVDSRTPGVFHCRSRR